jgi:peptide-methionine (S)-S-oxide reductase
MRFLILALALVLAPLAARAEVAVFAGGCFWCVEADFDKVPGVSATVSGFTGGTLANPTYDDVKAGGTGHYEAVKITFDPGKVSYAELVRLFLRSVDPLDAGGQFCDRGDSYRTAIFVRSEAQRAAAIEAVAEAEAALGRGIATKVRKSGEFWPADEYHQDYYRKSEIVLTRRGPKSKANAYKFYRNACGRDARVKEVWGAEAAFAK